MMFLPIAFRHISELNRNAHAGNVGAPPPGGRRPLDATGIRQPADAAPPVILAR
jgi:hypothetical protein